MAMFLAGVAAGVVLGAALGLRGLAVLAAVGIALLLATTSGIDLTALWIAQSRTTSLPIASTANDVPEPQSVAGGSPLPSRSRAFSTSR